MASTTIDTPGGGAAHAPAVPSEKVSGRTWMAVAAGMLGAFMAVLDIQITNSSLRDILGSREEGRTGIFERSRDVYQGVGAAAGASPVERERERAMASRTVSPSNGPDLRDSDPDRAPGLRYADKDKPL